MLKQVENPSMLDEIFREGWIHSGQGDYGHLLSWEQLNAELNHRLNHQKKVGTTRVRALWYSGIAASLLAVIALAWWLMSGSPKFEIYHTGYGETSEIVLDDGTHVILNANSSLVWHLELKHDQDGKPFRLAELEGEAFFDVSRIEDQDLTPDARVRSGIGRVPFKVRTPDLTVNVLGTAFNVLTRRGKTDVYLDHGSVELDLYAPAIEGGSVNADEVVVEKVMMKPGDMVSFSAMTRDLHKIETANHDGITEWKDGTLVFDKVDFGIMLDRLEDIYGKKFAVEDTSLLNTPISAGVPYENWEVVTRLLELTFNVTFKEDQNNIVRLEKRKG